MRVRSLARWYPLMGPASKIFPRNLREGSGDPLPHTSLYSLLSTSLKQECCLRIPASQCLENEAVMTNFLFVARSVQHASRQLTMIRGNLPPAGLQGDACLSVNSLPVCRITSNSHLLGGRSSWFLEGEEPTGIFHGHRPPLPWTAPEGVHSAEVKRRSTELLRPQTT